MSDPVLASLRRERSASCGQALPHAPGENRDDEALNR